MNNIQKSKYIPTTVIHPSSVQHTRQVGNECSDKSMLQKSLYLQFCGENNVLSTKMGKIISVKTGKIKQIKRSNRCLISLCNPILQNNLDVQPLKNEVHFGVVQNGMLGQMLTAIS